MSNIDRIAEVLGNHRYDISDMTVPRCICGKEIEPGGGDEAINTHRATLIDAALHPVIDTVEDLAALPVGTVVMDDMADVLQRFNAAGGWQMLGYGGMHLPVLPARVLYVPEPARYTPSGMDEFAAETTWNKDPDNPHRGMDG